MGRKSKYLSKNEYTSTEAARGDVVYQPSEWENYRDQAAEQLGRDTKYTCVGMFVASAFFICAGTAIGHFFFNNAMYGSLIGLAFQIAHIGGWLALLIYSATGEILFPIRNMKRQKGGMVRVNPRKEEGPTA